MSCLVSKNPVDEMRQVTNLRPGYGRRGVQVISGSAGSGQTGGIRLSGSHFPARVWICTDHDPVTDVVTTPARCRRRTGAETAWWRPLIDTLCLAAQGVCDQSAAFVTSRVSVWTIYGAL